MSEPYIAALNLPERSGLTPGRRGLNLLVTEDHRVLKINDNGENWLLMDGAWYSYATASAMEIGEDYPITDLGEVDWSFLSTFLPDQPPEMGQAFEVDFGGFALRYRSLKEAQDVAITHKSQFGGIGGSYRPAGWYRIRDASPEEIQALEQDCP